MQTVKKVSHLQYVFLPVITFFRDSFVRSFVQLMLAMAWGITSIVIFASQLFGADWSNSQKLMPQYMWFVWGVLSIVCLMLAYSNGYHKRAYTSLRNRFKNPAGRLIVYDSHGFYKRKPGEAMIGTIIDAGFVTDIDAIDPAVGELHYSILLSNGNIVTTIRECFKFID